MARYQVVDRSPRFLAISLEAQLMVGSFEHALDVLIDEELELSAFERWYCNDETGAPAYDPAVMLSRPTIRYSGPLHSGLSPAVSRPLIGSVGRLSFS